MSTTPQTIQELTAIAGIEDLIVEWGVGHTLEMVAKAVHHRSTVVLAQDDKPLSGAYDKAAQDVHCAAQRLYRAGHD